MRVMAGGLAHGGPPVIIGLMDSVPQPRAGATPEPPSLEDRELLDAIRSGSPDAFDRFVARFGPMILAFGLRMCGQRADAEDVFQETLVKVYTHVATLEDPAALRSWLWRIVANACLMSRRGPRDPARSVAFEELRRGRDDDARPVEFADESAVSPERAAIQGEERARIDDALRNLAPDYRIIVLLRDFEGLTTAEVADVLGITEANAKVRLHRARAALRRILVGGTTAEDVP